MRYIHATRALTTKPMSPRTYRSFLIAAQFASCEAPQNSFQIKRDWQTEMVTLFDLCVSSLRRGHDNLLCISSILMDDPRRESTTVNVDNWRTCEFFVNSPTRLCVEARMVNEFSIAPAKCACPARKADSTLRCSQADPHPSTNRALRRPTSEVRRDPVYSTRYGRQRKLLAFILLGLRTCAQYCDPSTDDRKGVKV